MKPNGNRLQAVSVRTTRLAYDLTAPFYPLSSYLFHRRAHRRLMELAGTLDGRRVLEVATGSGELFRCLLGLNHSGLTVGADLSPGMMSVVRRRLNGRNGHGNGNGGSNGRYALQAVDARQMPFRDGFFDTLFACYLLELLPPDDMLHTLLEFQRVLRPGGRLLLANVSDGNPAFNLVYTTVGAAVRSFWGRQVIGLMPELLARSGFRVLHQEVVRQTGYPSVVTVNERAAG